MGGWILGVLLASTAGAKKPLADQVGRYEFTVVQPPTRAIELGTVVVRVSDDPLVVRVLCEAPSTLGDVADLLQPVAKSQVARVFKGYRGALPDTEVAQLRQAAPALASLEGVNLEVENAREVRIGRIAAIEALPSRRSDPCTQAITQAAEAERPVGLIKAVVQADVTFTAQVRSGGDDAAVLQALGAALQLDATVEDGGLKATEVVVALEDDAGLALYDIGGTREGTASDSVPPDDGVRVEPAE